MLALRAAQSKRTLSWLLERQLDSAQEAGAIRALTGGSRDALGNVAAARKLDGVSCVRCHCVICLAVAKLRLETRKKLFLATLPCNHNLHTG